MILGPRQYDPTTARFTSPDVFVGAAADIALGRDELTGNRYLFAAANPVGFYEDGHGVCLAGHNPKTKGQKHGGCRGGGAAEAAGRAGKGTGHAARWVYRRTDISASACVLGGVTFGFQGGTLYIQRGAGLALGAGISAGLAARAYRNRACESVIGFAGPFYVAADGESREGWRDSEVGIAIGAGAGSAIMRSYDDRYCRQLTGQKP